MGPQHCAATFCMLTTFTCSLFSDQLHNSLMFVQEMNCFVINVKIKDKLKRETQLLVSETR